MCHPHPTLSRQGRGFLLLGKCDPSKKRWFFGDLTLSLHLTKYCQGEEADIYTVRSIIRLVFVSISPASHRRRKGMAVVVRAVKLKWILGREVPRSAALCWTLSNLRHSSSMESVYKVSINPLYPPVLGEIGNRGTPPDPR